MVVDSYHLLYRMSFAILIVKQQENNKRSAGMLAAQKYLFPIFQEIFKLIIDERQQQGVLV